MKPLLTLSVTALLSVGVTACGGAGTTTATKTSSSTATSSGGAANNVSGNPTPTRTTGVGASATSENAGGTDNNIPAYGHAASAADNQAVTALVKRYYAAAATADGATACTLLYPALVHAVPEDYGQAPGPAYARGKTCPVVMSKLFKHVAGHPADLAATEVTGVRVYRDRGFAMLRSKTTPNGEIFVERAGRSSWKVGVLIGRERPPIPPGARR
jgi:hypothetical protein